MLLPGDADDDLIEVPFVTAARRSLTNAVGEFPAEFEPPTAGDPPYRSASVSIRLDSGRLGYQFVRTLACHRQ